MGPCFILLSTFSKVKGNKGFNFPSKKTDFKTHLMDFAFLASNTETFHVLVMLFCLSEYHWDFLPSSTSDSVDSFTRLILCKESVDCDRYFQLFNKLSSLPTLQTKRKQKTGQDSCQPGNCSASCHKCCLVMHKCRY